MLKRITLIILFALLFFTRLSEGVCAEDKPFIKIGICALRVKERCLRNWTPTANYFSAKISRATFSIVPLEFDEVTDAVKNERVDFILTNSSFYVQRERAYQLNRIATLKNRVLNKVYTKFGGVIFCRKDRADIRQLSDLKGKTFTGKSFGGWLAGWAAPLNYESVAECLNALQVFPYQDEGGFTFADVLKKYWHLIIAFVSAFIILVFVTIFIFRLHHNLKLANKKLEQAIAECILTENELKKSEAKYRSLFESTPDAIMIADTIRFIDCNSAALSMFGFSSKEEFISQSPAQLSPLKQPDGRDSQETALGYIEEALKKGATFFEWTHRKKDGTTFPAEVMLSRIEVEGKDITQALVRDVTPRKQIETDRERLIRELQEALGHLRTLKGMLPICANCKKVRDDKGYWNQIESYVQQHTDASFTHGLCPDCAKQLYPDLYAERKKRKEKTWEFD